MVQFDDSHGHTARYRLWHHRHDSAAWYFEWKRAGIIGRIVDFVAPSPVAVVWVVVFVGGLAVLALLTMAVKLPWGW